MTIEITITYRLASNATVLGTEKSTGITEVLFPDANYFQNPITITKMFEGQSTHRWLVVAVFHPSVTEIVVDLNPRVPQEVEIYLAKTYQSKNSVISSLQKGVFVEVDYGHIHSVKKSCGATKSNKRYPDLKQVGEMHKRRLAIVVKASPNGIQIVPITSKKPSNPGDKSIFIVNPDSTQNLVHYNDTSKTSYALCNMIETVSLNRILPPLAYPTKQGGRRAPERSTGYPHKLISTDRKLLDAGLSTSMGFQDYLDLKTKYPALFKESEQLKEQIKQLETDLVTEKNKTAQMEVKDQHNGQWQAAGTGTQGLIQGQAGGIHITGQQSRQRLL